MNKQFLDETKLIEDSFRLAVKVYESDFRPTFIVGLWRGGSSVGIYVQECLQTLGVHTDHISLRTSYRGQPSYDEMIQSPVDQIRVHGTQYLLENLNATDKLLIVDDVFASGSNIQAVLNRLNLHLKRNMPEEIRIACLYSRASQRRNKLSPDFYLYETSDWLVFPYELQGLNEEEIAENKSYLLPILDSVKSK